MSWIYWVNWICHGINLGLLVYILVRTHQNSRILASLGRSLFSSLSIRQDALNRETAYQKQLHDLADTASTLAKVIGRAGPMSSDQVKAQQEHMKLLDERRKERQKEQKRRTTNILGPSYPLPVLEDPTVGVQIDARE